MPETNLTNVRCAPNNLTTRLTSAVTCASTPERNHSPVRSAAKVSSARTAWSSTPKRIRKRRPEQQLPPRTLVWPRCRWARRRVLLLLVLPSMPAAVYPPGLRQPLCDSSTNISRQLLGSGTSHTTRASCSKISWQLPVPKDNGFHLQEKLPQFCWSL